MLLQDWERFSLRLSRLTFGLLLVPYVVVNLFLPFSYFFRDYILFITLVEYIIEGIFLLTLFIAGFVYVEKNVGKLIFIIGILSAGSEIWDIVSDPKFLGFKLAAALFYPLMLMGLLTIILSILFLIRSLINYINKFRDRKISLSPNQLSFSKLTKLNYRKVLLPASLLVLAGVGSLLFSSGAVSRQIDISPQDYDIKFRIWANVEPEWYQEVPDRLQMLDQMDKHSVIIQNFLVSIGDENGIYESFSPTINTTESDIAIGYLTWFDTNYPNIGFHFYAYALGYDSNGNYEGSIYTPAMLKRFVDAYRTTNLTNVKGIYTDWEGPNREAPPINFTRNAYHQALWVDAMAYVDQYYPDWTFSCCFPQEMIWDPADSDMDMEYYHRWNVFHPEWDEYAPMVYRECDLDETDGSASKSSWYVYAQANALVNGLSEGESSRASFWLGCTGCGPYRGVDSGFEAYARDILILKHFQIPTVSIFHGIESHMPDDRLNGFFYEYGYDALDRLNDTVNGPSAREGFKISTDTGFYIKKDITADFLLNYNRYGYLPIFFAQLALGYGCLKIKFFRRPLANKNIR